jgi:acetate kinase
MPRTPTPPDVPDVADVAADVLVVNAGSSSLKVGRRPSGASVVVERIGEPGHPVDHVAAWRRAAAALEGAEGAAPLARVAVVAHRMVHGGERYHQPVVVDDDVIAVLEGLVPLAPLHNPANLAALRAARAALPEVPHVAVFDTAFHAGMAPHAYRYAVPEAWYRDHGVRRYGFHGPSHDGVTRRAAALLGRDRAELRIVSLHLGNGASAAAVDRGRSVETTMGFTPIDGLIMGTRSGALDPGVLLHLLRAGKSAAELDAELNRASGLLGLSGRSNDVRDLRQAADAGDDRAALALRAFAYRARLAIGSLAFAMGALDAVVFTGGIGQHDARMRTEVLEGLERFGIEVDPRANAGHGPRIDRGGAVAVLVVPTDEEGMMAEAALAAVAPAAPRRAP